MNRVSHIFEHLEDAAEPDRSLDWEIHLRHGISGVGSYGGHPNYTGSVDAAMTLVPRDSRIVLAGCNQAWHVAINSTPQTQRHPPKNGFARSAAIALCIAALQAEAALSTSNRGKPVGDTRRETK